jgi:hypothetical protein
MNWKAEVHRMNAAAYGWPKGWSSREEIAEQLECSPERVREVLNPGIKAGAIEVKDFKIWEDGRFVRRTGYRKVGVAAPEAKPAPRIEGGIKVGMEVLSRKRGNRGKVIKVVGDRLTIDWGGTVRDCGMSAVHKGDVRLA